MCTTDYLQIGMNIYEILKLLVVPTTSKISVYINQKLIKNTNLQKQHFSFFFF